MLKRINMGLESDVPRVFRKISMDSITFGTDCMALKPQPKQEQILRKPLTDEEKPKMLTGNARHVLRFKCYNVSNSLS